jgi:hypothetical protein
MDEQMTEDTLRAVAVMTATLEDPDGPRTLACDVVNEWGNESPDGANRIVLGFIQLSTMLLAQLQIEAGIPPRRALQLVAGTLTNWNESED